VAAERPAPAGEPVRSGIRGLQDKVRNAATTYLKRANSNVVEEEWSEF
jgi:hypothetical protein